MYAFAYTSGTFERSYSRSFLIAGDSTPSRTYVGASVSTVAGTRTTSTSPSRTRTIPSSVTTPIVSTCSSQRSNSARTGPSCSGRTITSIRSCDSLSITSYGVMPSSRRGTFATSMMIPVPAFAAHSTAALVSPAAPRSCSPTTHSWCSSVSSRHASISFFSMNGLPTCTAGRRSSLDSSSCTLANVAPWIPSRPVSAPTIISRLPGPSARARTSLSSRPTPTHIAFTSGLPEYDGENDTSPPTVGTPMQFPYPPIPATTPLKRCRFRAASSSVVRSSSDPSGGTGGMPASRLYAPRSIAFGTCSGPNRSESSSAIGRAPIAKMSRTIPPTPVAAPSYGSIADGWLCDSILNATPSPSPMSTTPAFSSPAFVRTYAPSVGNILSSGRLFL